VPEVKLEYVPAPWTKAAFSPALAEVRELLDGDIWRDATVAFHDKKQQAQAKGKVGPQGIQRFLNDLIDSTMVEAGWEGEDGRFRKSDTWVRITFRHQMSLEGDILEALRANKKEGAIQTAIIAASTDFLKLITPKDVHALCSFEKFRAKCLDLNGCLDFTLFIGRLDSGETLSSELMAVVRGPRPRGKTIPVRKSAVDTTKPGTLFGD